MILVYVQPFLPFTIQVLCTMYMFNYLLTNVKVQLQALTEGCKLDEPSENTKVHKMYTKYTFFQAYKGCLLFFSTSMLKK